MKRDYVGARGILLPIVQAGGSYDDAAVLHSVCKILADVACLEVTRAKLDMKR